MFRNLLLLVVAGGALSALCCGGQAPLANAPAATSEGTGPWQSLEWEAAAEVPEPMAKMLEQRLRWLAAVDVDVRAEGRKVSARWRQGPSGEEAEAHLVAVGDFAVVEVLPGAHYGGAVEAFDAAGGEKAFPGLRKESEWFNQEEVRVVAGGDPAALLSLLGSVPLAPGARWLAVRRWDFQAPLWVGLAVRAPVVTTADVESGSVERMPDGEPAMWVELSKTASMKFFHFTEGKVGQRVCVLVNGEVFSCPIIGEPVGNGRLMLLLPEPHRGRAAALVTAVVNGPLPVRLAPAI